MRTCPYCLYRFPDDAAGCPRCENTLPPTAPQSRTNGAAITAIKQARATALPTANLKPLFIGGAVIVVILVIAITVGSQLFGNRSQTTLPRSVAGSSSSTQATAAAGFPTPVPPSGWNEWLVAGNRLRLWLPESYQVVNFTALDWQNAFSRTLTQDSFLRSEANKIQLGSTKNTLLVGVSSRSDPSPVRVMVISVPSLAGNASPDPQNVQAFVNTVGIDGEVKNKRDRKACNTAKMTQMEIIPPKLNDPSAWRGYVLAATTLDDAYLMIALANPRDFATIRTTLEKALDSMCDLPSSAWATPTPTPSPTPSPTPTPTPSPTPSPIPEPLPQGWQSWRPKNNDLTLWLPKTFNIVDFTNKDWQNIYSPTLSSDIYLLIQAVRVRSMSQDTLIAAVSTTSTTSLRVIVIQAPELATTGTLTLNQLQSTFDQLDIQGNLSARTSTTKKCGAQITRTDLIPPVSSQWGGSVVAATTPTKGYLLAVLFNPKQSTDREAIENILGNLCILSP